MRHFVSFLVLSAVLAIGCAPTSQPKKLPGECLCDCPAGPPPAGQISTYCLDTAHDSAVCCLGPEKTGICRSFECVAQ